MEQKERPHLRLVKGEPPSGKFPGVSPATDQVQRKIVVNGKEYSIVRQIADTNFSVVSLAEDKAGKTVITKEINPSNKGWKSYELAEREAQVLKSLNHPNIVKLIDSDVGENQFNQTLVLEYVEGKTLSELIKEGKRFSKEEVLALIEQIGSALDYAHKMNPQIIHRDIKPDNIILGKDGNWVVLDWGTIEKLNPSGHNTTVIGIGNFGYTDPELYEGRKATVKSDIYSLAATVFYMLSGAEPHDRKEVLKGENGNLSEQVRKVLSGALEHDSDKRPYKYVNEFKEALISALNSGTALVPVQKEQQTALTKIEKLDTQISQLEIGLNKTGFVSHFSGILVASTLVSIIVLLYKNIPIPADILLRYTVLFVSLTGMNILRLKGREKLQKLKEERKFLQDGIDGKFRGMFDQYPQLSAGEPNWSLLDLENEVIVLDGKFTMKQAQQEAKKRDMVILPNSVIDKIIQDNLLRKKYADLNLFPCWTGTYVDINGKDCTVTQDGKSRKIKLPLKNGWYKVDAFGIPSGKKSNKKDKDARFLWRIESYSGPAGRGYYYLGDDNGQGVFLDLRPSGGCGVACVSRAKYEELLARSVQNQS